MKRIAVLALAACGSSGTAPATPDAPLHADAPAPDAAAPVPDAPAPADASTVCAATTAAALVACTAAVQSGTRTIIEVQAPIVCSGADACRVKIDANPVTIRGAAGGSIRRIDHHDYPLIQIIGVASATIADLTIDEDADVPCQPVSKTNPPVDNPACGRTIDVFGVADVTLDHVTIASSKSIAVFLNTCTAARVSHARFIAPLQFGLEVTGFSALTVEDTLFWHASSNAMVLYDGHGTANAPLVMRRTFFEHNHRDDVYYTCGPKNDAKCSGGQLLLAGKMDFLRVEGSVLRNGGDDLGDAVSPAGGVEVNTPAIHDITFSGDDVHTHGMWGIYMNTDAVDVARVTVSGNELYDNGKHPDYLGVDVGNFTQGIVTESATCHAAGCAPVRLGALWAVPGGPVSWITNDATAPKLTVAGAQVSTAASGQMAVAAGAEVILYDGATELDRLTAR